MSGILKEPNRLKMARTGGDIDKRSGELTRHSRLFARGPVDGRSTEGRYLQRVRLELARQFGGNPSPIQNAMIERIAALRLRLIVLDEKAARGDVLSFEEERAYVSLSSSIVRALRELGFGLKGAGASGKRGALTEYLRRKDLERAAAAAKDAAQ
jgi:hypothetical protein